MLRAARFVAMVAVVAVGMVGGPARADRGALTVDVYGAFDGVMLAPPVGSGKSMSGSTWETGAGLRYGLSNHLELTAGGFWDVPADRTWRDVSITTPNGTFTGTLAGHTNSWGLSGGARYCAGLTFRRCAGAEAGALLRSDSGLDLVDVANPGGPVSFGLVIRPKTTISPTAAATAGIEWMITDKLSVSFMPKVRWAIGEAGGVAFVLPLTVSYGWYGLFR